MPWTLLGPLEVRALWLGVQGRESVAELVPDFLVKPLIPPNACFRFFQVVVLGPHCHQLVGVSYTSRPELGWAECTLAMLTPSDPVRWPVAKGQGGLLVGVAERASGRGREKETSLSHWEGRPTGGHESV